jgi:predicted nucleic-acid-binding protein
MRGNAKPYALDANVILRFILRDHGELSSKAREIMQAASDGRIAVHCDPVIVAEVVYVLASNYGASRVRIAEALESVLKPDSTVMQDKERYLRALRIYAETNAHFGDACACATALDDCEGRLLSFDRALSKIAGIARSERPE